MTALIRTDGSSEIGMGHVTRCMALAEGLREKGLEILFLIKDHDSAVIKFIKDRGCTLKIISKNSSIKQEIMFFNRCIKKYKPRFLVTDSYSIDNEYLKKLDTKRAVLVSIDGLIRKVFCFDIVINQNAGVRGSDYKDMLKKGASLLLGPKYFLLRKEFRNVRRNKNRIKSDISSILICMGGANSVNATLKIVKSLRSHLNNGIEVKIIVGTAYKHTADLKKIIDRGFGRITLYSNPLNFAEIVFASDIVICSGGVTCKEVLYLGIPAIVVIIADNQIIGTDNLAKKGTLVTLGKYSKISKKTITKNVDDLISNKDKRTNMSLKARKLIDGRGVSRIIKEMEICCEKNKNRK